ncbi:MAG TPA: alcohol dehydrogenase catalytic domain-containing protein [Limnochordales bacterium]
MEAAVFRGAGRLAIETVPVPRIRRDDDVLLRVLACGVCGTDLHILSVPPGHPASSDIILGHEYTGEVLQVGPAVTHLKPGDRVVVDANIKCGTCIHCRSGRSHMCENMTTLGIFEDGGFARYNVAPARALHPIDPAVPPHLAAFAELLSCIVNGARKVRISPGAVVVILGAGPAGLLFTQLARAAGARVVVAEVSPYRQRFARESGAELVVDPKAVDVREAVMRISPAGADVVIDAVGSLFAHALPLVRRQGQVLLFGMDATATAAVPQVEITRNELEVRGTYIADGTFPDAIA